MGSKDTDVNMATTNDNSDLYQCQVNACRNFFHEQLPDVSKRKPLQEDKIPDDMKFKKPIQLWDVTGCNAKEVVAVFYNIVNDREKFTTGKNFYVMIKHDAEKKELFKLTAWPTQDQPGNGMIAMRSRGSKKFAKKGKTYKQLSGALRKHYQNTTTFTKDIRKIFLNNEVSDCKFPQVTVEAYMLFLFEIARRLVKLKEPSEKKEQFDALPIGSAIARIVKLLEYGKDTVCTYENVFLPKGRFHFFSGKPETRKRKIDDINTALVNAESEKTATTLDVWKVMPGKELEEMFCSRQKRLRKNL